MLNIRLKPEQETYLNNFVENKSEYVRGLIEEDMEDRDDKFLMEALTKCKGNFMKFLSRHAPNIGINSVRRYDEEIAYYFDKGENVFVNKGRQLGITGLFATCGLWFATFKPKTEVVMLSYKLDGAKALIKKARNAYKGTSPSEMLPDMKNSTTTHIELENGSEIKAKGANSYEPRNPDLLVLDEMGFMNRLELGHLSYPRTQILVSSTGIRKSSANHEPMISMSKHGSVFEYLEVPSTASKNRGAEWVEEQKEMLGEERYRRENNAVREI